MNNNRTTDRQYIRENVRCRCTIEDPTDAASMVETIRDLIRQAGQSGREWKSDLASWLVDQFVDTSFGEKLWTNPQPTDIPSRQTLIAAMNLSLTQMSRTAAIACEIANSVDPTDHSPTLSLELPEINNDGSTIRQILEQLATILIAALDARDDYRYDALIDSLDECDDMPLKIRTERFTAFRCLRMVARAGQSRTANSIRIGEFMPIEVWRELPQTIRQDSDLIHHLDDAASELQPCMAYPLLILVSSIGHLRREHAAKLLEDPGTSQIVTSVTTWLTEDLDRCFPAQYDTTVVEPVRHHLFYYRYFVYHFTAITIVDMYPDLERLKIPLQLLESQDEGEEVVSDHSPVWKSGASAAYELAVGAIENALSSVPASSRARREYYNITAENLEHEMNLRLALLDQRIAMDKKMRDTEAHLTETIKELAKTHVDERLEVAMKGVHDEISKELKVIQNESSTIQSEVRNISVRVVEIIGIFLAVVAFLGTTVVSGTAGDLSVSQRLLILGAGGVISLLFFVLLRRAVSHPITSGLFTPSALFARRSLTRPKTDDDSTQSEQTD